MITNGFYVVWSTPFGSTPTQKRIAWVASQIDGATTEEGVADGIWNGLAGDAPFEPTAKPLEEGADWKLLDGNVGGECDEQASLMLRAANLSGLAAEVKLLRASRDSSVYDVENKIIAGRKAYLVMDFTADGDPPELDGSYSGINLFEAICLTAGKAYAVWPHIKADSAAALFNSLPFEQWWVYTNDNLEPVPGSITEIAKFETKPTL